MSRVRLCVCVLACAALLVLPGPASADPPRATAAKACGTLTLTVGKSIVRARNVRCADARRFVAALLSRDCGETHDCSSTRISFRGYRCLRSQSPTLMKNSCTKGRKVISELHG